MQNVNKCEY